MSATRERALAALAKFQPRRFDAPALGGEVVIHPLSIAGFSRLSEIQRGGEGEMTSKVSVAMVIDCVRDDQGERVFTQDDADLLERVPFPAIAGVIEAIEELSGLKTDGIHEASGN